MTEDKPMQELPEFDFPIDDIEGMTWDESCMTRAEIEELLGRDDLARLTVEAIRNTNRSKVDKGTIEIIHEEQEWGFVGHQRYIITQEGKKTGVELSKLFSGDERSMNLEEQVWNEEPDEALAIQNQRAITFHTHPNLLRNRGLDRLLGELAGRTLTMPQAKLAFSEADLTNFQFYCSIKKNWHLFAVAGCDSNNEGEILIVSSKSLEASKNLSPRRVYSRYRSYVQAGADPYEAYREAGLNVAVVQVDIEKGELDKDDVQKAAKILSQSD